jgi:hypothetical protein
MTVTTAPAPAHLDEQPSDPEMVARAASLLGTLDPEGIRRLAALSSEHIALPEGGHLNGVAFLAAIADELDARLALAPGSPSPCCPGATVVAWAHGPRLFCSGCDAWIPAQEGDGT